MYFDRVAPHRRSASGTRRGRNSRLSPGFQAIGAAAPEYNNDGSPTPASSFVHVIRGSDVYFNTRAWLPSKPPQEGVARRARRSAPCVLRTRIHVPAGPGARAALGSRPQCRPSRGAPEAMYAARNVAMPGSAPGPWPQARWESAPGTGSSSSRSSQPGAVSAPPADSAVDAAPPKRSALLVLLGSTRTSASPDRSLRMEPCGLNVSR